MPTLRIYREKIPWPNPAEDALHTGNFRISALVAILLSTLLLVVLSWQHAILLPLVLLPLHSRVFDRAINKALGNDPDYLGEGSSVDMWLKKHFGKDAGRKKNRLCLVAVAVLNIVSVALCFI